MNPDLKWLTLEKIKAQLRIEPDFHDEDDLLEEYGEEAEDTVLNLLNRDYTDLIDTYGKVPAPIRRASLMLCDISYAHRSPVGPQQMYLVPYSFDLMIKPYMKLTTNGLNNNEYGKHCNL